MAVTRRAELDFTLPERAEFPAEVLLRFPGLKEWSRLEAERVRMLEQTVRELVTAVREDIETPGSKVVETVLAQVAADAKPVSWETIINKPECFPGCEATTPTGQFVATVNGA